MELDKIIKFQNILIIYHLESLKKKFDIFDKIKKNFFFFENFINISFFGRF
jgi:hypothetical protein